MLFCVDRVSSTVMFSLAGHSFPHCFCRVAQRLLCSLQSQAQQAWELFKKDFCVQQAASGNINPVTEGIWERLPGAFAAISPALAKNYEERAALTKGIGA